jgi:hypothetical protein
LNFRRKKIRPKGTNHFEELSINWRIILKWIWTAVIFLRIGTISGTL